MATDILDQGQDALGEAIYRVTSLYGPPEYVKNASRADLCGSAATPAHAYAATHARRFPLDTPAAVWMSAALYEDQAGGEKTASASVRERIDSAAAYFGIAPEIARVRAKAAALREALPVSKEDYAFILRLENGGEERRAPLRNPGEVKAAAAWLARYRDEFAPGDRRTIARNILAKAAALKVALGDDGDLLDRLAGFGTTASSEVRALLLKRAALLERRRHGAVAVDLRALAVQLESPDVSARSPELLEKVAAAVDQVDRQTGLAVEYDRGLERPDDVLFAVTEKTAGDCLRGHVQLLSGALYKVADLARLRVADVADCLGAEMAEALSSDGIHLDHAKMAEVLPTLDRGAAALFDRLASRLQVEPVVKQASAATGLSRRDLALLAD